MQLMIGELRASVPDTVPTGVEADSLNVRSLMLPGATAGQRAYSGPQGDISYPLRMPAHLRRAACSNRARVLPANWSGSYGGRLVTLNGELLSVWVPAFAGCPLSVRIAMQINPPPAADSSGVGHTVADVVLAWGDYEPGLGGVRDTKKELLVSPTVLWQTNSGNQGYDATMRKSWTRTVVIVPDADGPLKIRLYGAMSGGAPVHNAMVIVS
jgi:hypothetical protein